MALLDGLLGGNDSSSVSNESNSSSLDLATAPQLGLDASDVLRSLDSSSEGGSGGDSDSSSFTGIGDLGLDFAAPTLLGIDSMSESSNASEQDGGNGGLLQGLI